MNKELLIFNGGMQTKIAPHLAEPNQAIVCENIDLSKGNIYPMPEPTLSNDTSTGYYNILTGDGILVSSDEDEKRSYARYGTRLYFSNGDYGAYGLYRVQNDGTIVDAVPPEVTTFGGITFGTNVSNGNLYGDYSYVYTVVDEEGIESVPSLPYTVTATNENVVINFGADTVTEAVVRRNLYRTGGNNPTFNLIAEIPTGTDTYTDETRDLDVSRIELNSFDSTAPISDIVNLVESNGTLWASSGDRVYFSNNGRPEFWSPMDYVVLNDTCTGIGSYRDSILAFTNNECYYITGFNRDNISVEKLPYKEGCITHFSITNITEYVVWTSKNGICVFDGSQITVITKNMLEWIAKTTLGSATFDSINSSFDSNIGYNVIDAIGLDGKYYGVFQGGIGIFDLDRNVASVITHIENPRGLYYDYGENAIAVINSDKEIYYLTATSFGNMDARWKTPELTLTSDAKLKQFRKIMFDKKVKNLIVYVDGKEVSNKSNRSTIMLPSGSVGRNIQLDITTDVEINSVEIQYGVLK